MSEFLGLEVEVPFAPAMGAINGPNVDSIIDRNRQVLASPLSFSRWGSTTYAGGEGNEPLYGRVYYHNSLTGQTVNSLGLPSVGIETMVSVYPELQKEAEDRGKDVIPGISPGKGEDPFEVLPEMAERLVEVGVKRLEVNYSCPNKIDEQGGREPILSHDIDSMTEIDQEIIRRIGVDIWLIRKIAPLVGEKRKLIVPTAVYFAQAAGRVALSFNTIGGQSILTEMGDPALQVPGNLGGLSGPATGPVGRDMTSSFRDLLPEHVQIDSTLGVVTGKEVFRRTKNGADFTSGVTVFWQNEELGMDYRQTGIRIADEFMAAKLDSYEKWGDNPPAGYSTS